MTKTPKEKADEFLANRLKAMSTMDDALWRHALAEAVVALLERGTPVTVDSLVAHLQEGFDSDDVLLSRKAISEAAITRLLAIQQN